ncbi:MAG: T9SS type A sorting domain-containing protein [candidate division WOR-3 bacterium]
MTRILFWGLIFFCGYVLAADVGVVAITGPAEPRVQPGQEIVLAAIIRNFDSQPAGGYAVVFQVDSSGQMIYEETATPDSLPPGGERTVSSPRVWVPQPVLWSGYTLRVYTRHPGDSFPGNDTLEMRVLFTSDTVRAFFSELGVPVIDGNIEPEEWSWAGFMSSANFARRGNSSIQHQSYAWYMSGDSFLYAAFSLPEISTRSPADEICLFIDENNNSRWEPDSSEGNYQIVIDSGGVDRVYYYPWTSSGPSLVPLPVPGALAASSVSSGNLQFECRIPFGSERWQLNLHPDADTCRLFFFQKDAGEFHGWWPMVVDDTTGWQGPAFYGKLLLTPLQSDFGWRRIISPAGIVDTNIFVLPRAELAGFGSGGRVRVWFYIYTPDSARVYADSEEVFFSAGGGAIIVDFDSFYVNNRTGIWGTKCSLYSRYDINSQNDVRTGYFIVSGQGVAEDRNWGDNTGLAVFPQVVSERVRVRNAEAGNFLLYDATGRLRLEQSLRQSSAGEVDVDLQSLEPGIYFIRLPGSRSVVRKLLFVRK